MAATQRLVGKDYLPLNLTSKQVLQYKYHYPNGETKSTRCVGGVGLQRDFSYPVPFTNCLECLNRSPLLPSPRTCAASFPSTTPAACCWETNTARRSHAIPATLATFRATGSTMTVASPVAPWYEI